MRATFLALLMILAGLTSVQARDNTPKDTLAETMAAFSHTTMADGGGWEAYASYLHPDFTRWTAGEGLIDGETLVTQMRDWWTTGARQKSSERDVIGISVAGNIGIARLKVRESFMDAEGADTGTFQGYVDETWVREDGSWKLLALNIFRTPEQDD